MSSVAEFPSPWEKRKVFTSLISNSSQITEEYRPSWSLNSEISQKWGQTHISVPPLCVFTDFSVLTSRPHQPEEQGSSLPLRPTTTRPARVALPVYGVGADTDAASQRPIQSPAYEISSSAAIPYTSSAYSHIQSPAFTSCLGEIERKPGTDKIVFMLSKEVLSADLGNQPWSGLQKNCEEAGTGNETQTSQ